MNDWLEIIRGQAALIVSIPHAGTQIPHTVTGFKSYDIAVYDTDFYVDRLYDFAKKLDATIIQTRVSRSVIDVNRDPSGKSLYQGQATTGLCPLTTFDGAPLYDDETSIGETQINWRRENWFDPYHAALRSEIARLRANYPKIVLYDAHSIRSEVPRLFEGVLPQFNIGTFDGQSCDAGLTAAVAEHCEHDSSVINGRFKGGWITRHYGAPQKGVHAIQMELAIRGYADDSGNWPPIWCENRAVKLQETLEQILRTCIRFAKEK